MSEACLPVVKKWRNCSSEDAYIWDSCSGETPAKLKKIASSEGKKDKNNCYLQFHWSDSDSGF